MDAPPWPVQGWGGTGLLETVFTEDTPGTLSAVHPSTEGGRTKAFPAPGAWLVQLL